MLQNRGTHIFVDTGQVIKFINPEGPNIIDVWWFSADIKDSSGEKYDPVYTAGLEGFICRKNSRLCSPELIEAGHGKINHASCQTNAIKH